MSNTDEVSTKITFRIGLLCLDYSYYIYHLLGIAEELSQIENVEVRIFCSPQNGTLIQNSHHISANIKNSIKILEGPKWLPEIPYDSKMIPRRIYREIIHRCNTNDFKKLDVFVSPSYEYLFLKNYYPEKAFIYAKHGIPNGPYSFDQRITQFDLFFLTGIEEKNSRQEKGQLTDTNHQMVGFLKYDIVKDFSFIKLFNNQNNTVLYNPHWKKSLTSFHKFGFAILDFFASQKNYNLIFAPHANLMAKNPYLRYSLRKYRKYPNLIVDLVSERCNDMTYTKYADLYLGDVSSQSLEYLFIQPRPLLFLDAHQLAANKINRPISWDLGEVIDHVDNLEMTIEKAFSHYQAEYLFIQQERTKDLFYQGKKDPSVLAVEAITRLIKLKY